MVGTMIYHTFFKTFNKVIWPAAYEIVTPTDTIVENHLEEAWLTIITLEEVGEIELHQTAKIGLIENVGRRSSIDSCTILSTEAKDWSKITTNLNAYCWAHIAYKVTLERSDGTSVNACIPIVPEYLAALNSILFLSICAEYTSENS